MARYFAGNTLASFYRVSTATVESTLSARFNSAFVSSSIFIDSTNDYIETPPFASAATGTVWFHFEFYLGNATTGHTAMAVLLNGSTGVFRVSQVSSSTMKMQYWNGTAWTDTGSTFSFTNGTLQRMDVRVDLGSGAEVFLNGTSVASGSGWTGGGTSVTKLQLRCPSFSNQIYYSQVMVADYDLRDSRFMALALNGNSTANAGAASGLVSDINETVLNEATSISIGTSGNKAGQTHAALTVPTGYLVGALVFNARGRVNGAITDGKLGVRSGGVNYSSSGKGYTAGFEPRVHIVESDPATGTLFTQAGVNAAETYLEAV